MKKIFALVLVFIMLFSFAACKEKEKNTATIDIEYYANLGKMPETEYALGDDVETVKKGLEKAYDEYLEGEKDNENHNHDHDAQAVTFNEFEGENTTALHNGIITYYYVNEEKSSGIAYIVNSSKSFGFELGTSILDIKKALGDTKFSEDEVTEETAFFATSVTDGTLLKIKNGNVVTLFVFQENELYATAMYDSKIWD